MDKRLGRWKLSDLVPGDSNIVFRKDNINYYFQHLFHKSPTFTYRAPIPLLINDVHHLQKIEQVYLSIPILKNLYILLNHPVHELEIFGRCLGVFYKDGAKFMLCFIDDGSCQNYLTCKVDIVDDDDDEKILSIRGKFVKMQGTLRMFKDIIELHVINYDILGDESNLDIQINAWNKLLSFKKQVLDKPWVYTNTDYIDEEDEELQRLYNNGVGNFEEDETHSMTKTIYNNDENQFQVIVISDDDDDERDKMKPCDLTQSLLSLKFEFVIYCLQSQKRKLSLQEIFNHLNKRQLNDLLSLRMLLSNTTTNSTSWSNDLKSLKFEIFHGVRHELTQLKLIKCTKNLNCKIDNLIAFTTYLFKTIIKVIKNKNYIIKLNVLRYLSSYKLKNNGVTMDIPLLNKLIEYCIEQQQQQQQQQKQGFSSNLNGEWVLQGDEWVYTNNIASG